MLIWMVVPRLFPSVYWDRFQHPTTLSRNKWTSEQVFARMHMGDSDSGGRFEAFMRPKINFLVILKSVLCKCCISAESNIRQMKSTREIDVRNRFLFQQDSNPPAYSLFTGTVQRVPCSTHNSSINFESNVYVLFAIAPFETRLHNKEFSLFFFFFK